MTISTVTFTLDGTTTTLEKQSDGTYSATITAPSATSGSHNSGNGPGVGGEANGLGYYPGVVKVTDDSGNVTTVDTTNATWGTVLQLKVEENDAPSGVLTYPTAGAFITTAKPTITCNFTDSGSGINPSAAYVVIDGGTAVALTKASVSGSTMYFTYTPSTNLSEGSHTIKVYASDYDGNKSDEYSATFKVDTVAPTLNVSSPADGLKTNSSKITVAGTTSDATSSPVTVTVQVGSGTAQTVSVGTGGAWSTEVTLSEGSNTITVVAKDSAGKTTTVTRTVTLNTTAPVITKITLTPNPVDGGKTYTITVTATDE